MNKLDPWYQSILQQIIDEGVTKSDRTGTGTKSIFGVQFKHDMRDGFPILTTKKVYFKSVVTELLWFLRGDTNIKYLLDNGCNIWNGDAYKNYLKNRNGFYNKDSVKEKININGIKGSSNRAHTKEEFIEKIKTDDDFSKTWGSLGKVYGKQWRDWGSYKLYGQGESVMYGGIDQISNLINELKTNPDSRRMIVNAWNVSDLQEMVLSPCHYGFQVYTRELSESERFMYIMSNRPNQLGFIEYLDGDGKGCKSTDYTSIPTRAISLMWNQRSVDTFLGLPFNISSYGLLLKILAKIANMVPDQLIGNLGDVHLYNNHIEQAKEQIGRTSFDLPTINFNPIFLANLEHKGLDEAINNQINIQLENYQSHPAIKAPLSN